MTDLNYNEIATLRHHADGNQKVGIPEGLTPSQYYTAARSLRDKGLVYAGFIEGGELEAIKIKHEGQAVVDDMLRDEKRILRRILFGYDLTLDQYDLLNYIKKNGTSMGHSKHMGIENWREYYYSIPAPIAEKGLIKLPENDDNFIFSHNGKQVLEDIEDDLNEELTQMYSGNVDNTGKQKGERNQEASVRKHDKSFNIEEAVSNAPQSAFSCFIGNPLNNKKVNAIKLMKELVEERCKYTDGQLRSKKNEILVSVLKNNHHTIIHSRPSKETFTLLLAPCVGISCNKKNVNAYDKFLEKLDENVPLLR